MLMGAFTFWLVLTLAYDLPSGCCDICVVYRSILTYIEASCHQYGYDKGISWVDGQTDNETPV